MVKNLGILVIHGMGSQKKEFGGELIEKMGKRVQKNGKDPEQIAWKTVFWADVLHQNQMTYFDKASRTADLDYRKLRKFVITAFGDATAYQKVSSHANTTYSKIHERVRQGIKELYEEGLSRSEKPLLVMAHSLGGQIMSNYIWDIQHGSGPVPANGSSFEKMEALSGIITFGCNIPLFTFAYEEVIPISFPPASLPPEWKSRAKWLDFYDPDDVLGYPLKPISPPYAEVVNEDIVINAGNFFTSWDPMSHGGYWTDKDFIKPAAQFACEFL